MTSVAEEYNPDRIKELNQDQDKNLLFTAEELASAPITYTHDLNAIQSANFYIIAVPTSSNKATSSSMSRQFIQGPPKTFASLF